MQSLIQVEGLSMIGQANVRAHRIQATFASQKSILKHSGAARLLGLIRLGR